MAENAVTSERLQAGADYLAALEQLGFIPEGAMWTMRLHDAASLELSIFTGLVDRVGTMAMFKTLFEAFDRAKTPRSFDPWLIALYSPDQLLYEPASAFSIPAGSDAAVLGVHHKRQQLFGSVVLDEFQQAEERIVMREWIYKQPTRQRSAANDQLRQWRRFERAVAAAA